MLSLCKLNLNLFTFITNVIICQSRRQVTSLYDVYAFLTFRLDRRYSLLMY